VSIRPGWFYRAGEDDKVKSATELFQLYLKSTGRGANLLLNVPPDQRGLIHAIDSVALVNFNQMRTEAFGNDLCRSARAEFLAAGVTADAPELLDGFQSTSHEIVPGIDQMFRIYFPTRTKVNCISIMEAIQYGQSVKEFEILLWDGNKVVQSVFGTTIGRKRILTFPEKEITRFSIVVHQAKGAARIAEVSAYLFSPDLVEKKVE
jgi:alpha-L-fucosidase